MRPIFFRLFVLSLTFIVGATAVMLWLRLPVSSPEMSIAPVPVTSYPKIQASESSADEINWESLPQFTSIVFSEKQNVWFISADDGDLWMTKDGGARWIQVSSDAVGGSFQSLSFINEREGWAVNGDGEVWRSNDGGQTWLQISTLIPVAGDDWRFGMSDKMEFVDELHGWLVETFSIWRTEDGGYTWVRALDTLDSEVEGQPTGLSFINSREGWFCGTDGDIFRTVDGAKSWQKQMVDFESNRGHGTKTAFRDVIFLNQQDGWLLGYDYLEQAAKLFRTDDGGKTWRLLPGIAKHGFINSIGFINDKEGWAVGSNLPQMSSEIYRTENGGLTWHPVQVGRQEPFYERVHFIDDKAGWLFSRDNVYRTEDGGRNWQTVLELPPLAGKR